jgi:S-adenosylmethionine-diacylglycerol 3-amino-3-carboxypropyl transferase
MQQALDELEEGSVELVLLSDILDALPAGEVADCLQRAHRVLRPGGRVVVRQLNSTLDLPAIECGLEWDRELGMRLLARDRSFCNNAIHVGAKV